MLTLQESVSLRQRNLLFLLARHLGFCSLYRVPETVWKSLFDAGYGRTTNRAMHPGLSLSGPRHSLDPVPMLHGTTGTRGPVTLWGIMRTDPEHPTSFGHLLAPVPLHSWLGKDGVAPLPEARRLNGRERKLVVKAARQRGWL